MTEPGAELTGKIIGAAIEVHRNLGPGLLESAYEECLAFELDESGLNYRRQVVLPIRYKKARIDMAYRVDLLVEEEVIVELKTVLSVLPVHRAQLLTYLRLSGFRLGLLINFQVPALRDGVHRLAL